MRDVFERAFGLRDNPFNPLEYCGVDPNRLDGISTRALEIDEDKRLKDLFVPDAGPFEAAIEEFAELLQLNGYRSGFEPRLGPRSFVFRIIGPQGSGKSTLTNVMIDWLKDCKADRQLLVLKASLRYPDRLSDQLAGVRQEVIDRDARWCVLAFDDVNSADERELHELYRDLQMRRHVVLFASMHDADDLRIKLSSPVPVREFRTTGLAPDHAKRFVEHRVDLFRFDPARPLLCDDLMLFPFDPDDVAGAVRPHHAAANGSEPGVITLRTLNQVLHRGLEHAALRKPGDLSQLSVDDLRAARVRVLDLFAEALRAAA